MRRFVACCLVSALAEMAVFAAALHTHAYAEHEHREHHHGLAAHVHQDMHAQTTHHHDDGGPAWEPCGPGLHRTSASFVAPGPVPLFVGFANVEQPFVLVRALLAGLRTFQSDVRVHGPPLLLQTSPRAPPLIALRSIT